MIQLLIYRYMRTILLLNLSVALLLISNVSYSQDREGLDRALFFAVNDYQNAALTDLKNPIQEANAIASELKNRFGFSTEVVENPTFNAIETKLNEYRDAYQSGQWKPEGQLFIYFTGHGLRDEIGANGYFVPSDGDSWLSTVGFRLARNGR